MRPCGHAAMRPCGHAAMRPCGHAAMRQSDLSEDLEAGLPQR
jgi:hypothetical protein